MGYIYMHKNKINGKIYVGQTVREKANYRWGNNGKKYIDNNSNSHFSNAIKKYGWNNFEHIIICECELEQLDDKEREYIKLFDSTNPEKGYNSESGGNKNKIISEDAKQKMSKAHKGKPGRKLTEEERKKMSESRKGKNNPMYGVKGKDHPNFGKFNRCNCKKVIKITPDNHIEEYASVAETARKNNTCFTNISGVCHGRNGKKYKKNIYLFKNEYNGESYDELTLKFKEIYLEKIKNNFIDKSKMNIVGVKVDDCKEIIHFDNIYEATKFINRDTSKIKDCLYKRNRRKSTGGYYWFTLEEYNEKSRNKFI